MRLLPILTVALTLSPALCQGQGVITTVAGTGTCCKTTDGGAATSTWLPGVAGITVDLAGNFYIWDGASFKVHKVNTAGIISTVAGNGTPGGSGDGGLAINAQLFASGS